ncbi:FkbM family methyltransferase [Lichenicola cladoniae]|nr:FkbM family methyltransferase [Lichenicola cladoniae]
MLHDNIRRNKLEKRIRPITCALSNSNGYSNLYMLTQEHGLVETSASLEASFKSNHSSSNPVLVRTLDRAMLHLAPFVRQLSLIKVDVEGHETALLAGTTWTTRRYRPIIFIEILPNADIESLNQLVRLNRYTDVRPMAGGTPVIGSDVVYHPESWNHAFVSTERLSWFTKLQ